VRLRVTCRPMSRERLDEMSGESCLRTSTLIRGATLAAFMLVASSGCAAALWGPPEIRPVYAWTDCYPIDNDVAERLGLFIDFCADPDWRGQHWGVVAYYGDSQPQDYLALAWGIWYRTGRRPDLSGLRVLLRLEDGTSFVGASGARPQFACRSDGGNECADLVVTLRGADGTVAERVVHARARSPVGSTR
jgi:hypothetical protein